MLTGSVKQLFITKRNPDKTHISVKSILVDTLGIKDDKFYGKNEMRSILITSTDSYTLAKEEKIDIQIGSLGENILIDINPYALSKGDKIKFGNTLLEITQHCTLCQGLSSVNSKLPKLLKNDRGIFAKYIQGDSKILLGDSVQILKS